MAVVLYPILWVFVHTRVVVINIALNFSFTCRTDNIRSGILGISMMMIVSLASISAGLVSIPAKAKSGTFVS